MRRAGRRLGEMVGVAVPVCSVEHQYMITEAMPGVTATCRPERPGSAHLLQGRGRRLGDGGL